MLPTILPIKINHRNPRRAGGRCIAEMSRSLSGLDFASGAVPVAGFFLGVGSFLLSLLRSFAIDSISYSHSDPKSLMIPHALVHIQGPESQIQSFSVLFDQSLNPQLQRFAVLLAPIQQDSQITGFMTKLHPSARNQPGRYIGLHM